MAGRTAKRVGFAAVVVMALGAALHAYNYVRLDAGALRTNIEPVLERSRELRDKARPEYQELALATLPRNALNGPGYRLDELADRAFVKEKPASTDGNAQAILRAFDFDDPANPSFVTGSGTEAPVVQGGVLRAVSSSDGFLTNPAPLDIPVEDIGDILIRAKADKGTYMRLAWAGQDGPENGRIWRNKLDIRFRGHGEMQTYVVNARTVLRRGLGSAGARLGYLYLQVSDEPGATVEIDSIQFFSKTSRYLRADHGLDYESVNDVMRRVLYMRPNQTLEYAIKVPEHEPTIEFATHALLSGRPLTFEVTLAAGGVTETLHSSVVSDPAAWHDWRADLSAWAGRDVSLSLRVSGDPSNVGFWASPRVSSAPAKPFNVIFLVEDAQRADYLSVYGHPKRTTPFKEELVARRGVLFEQAITQAEKTRPSAASYMTSLYPTATGLWHFSDVLSERQLTLAEIMRAQGYETAAFIDNGNAGPFAGLHQGFDQLFEPGGLHSTEEVFHGDKLQRWLEQHRNRNFFLYLHAIDPHAPYDPPEPFRSKAMKDVPEQGTSLDRNPVFDADWVSKPTMESRRALYEGEIEYNDSVVRSFFERLDEMGLSENTLVVMFSDHGEYLGERGFFGNRMWDHRPPGFMIGTHVQLIFVYLARFRQSKRIPETVQLLDIAPTVLDLAGVDRSDLLLQGESLLDLIEGQRMDYWRNRVVVSEEPTAMLKGDPCSCGSLWFRGWHLVSSNQMWKRNRIYAPHLQAFLTTNVYAVETGRSESLAASFLPDLFLRYRQQALLSELRESNMAAWQKLVAGDEGGQVIDPDTLEQLKGLGYVN
jgi:arylsulfatase A-like enzyme